MQIFLRIVLAGIFLFPSHIFSQSSTISNYFLRTWQVENGLPQNKVTAMVQTRDGYLWIGTYSGLARFDGTGFTVFDDKNTPAMRNSRVTSLYETEEGTLWIGHENGTLTVRKDGIFTPVSFNPGEQAGKIYDISADEKGDIWFLSEGGLLTRVRDEKVLSPPTGTAMKLLNLIRQQNGAIWLARDGRLSRLVNEHFELQEGEADTYVQGMCASHDGGLWVASNGRVHKLKNGSWSPNIWGPWKNNALTRLYETTDGTLIAATSNNGFFMVYQDTNRPSLHFSRTEGFPADWIISLFEDREKNLWAGTGGNGLIELHLNNINTVAPPDNWHGRTVLSVCAGADDELWIGTEGAGVYQYAYKTGDWKNYGFTNGVGNSYVWSVAKDLAGNIWAGTWGAGLYLKEGDHFKAAPGMEDLKIIIPAMLVADDGIWVGSSLGLLNYKNGQTNWFLQAGQRYLRDVRTIAAGKNGAIWFGMAGNGLGRLENGKITLFHQTDGLPSNYIECLHFEEDGTLWIGTFGGGLCRLKNGKFTVIDEKNGLPNNVIGDIEDDGGGFFWMSSHAGLIRVNKNILNRCADGEMPDARFLSYGINDGMPTIECSEGLQPAGCKTSDGRLWFPTSKGLVVVKPGDVKMNHLPPPMAREEFVVDGSVMTNTGASLRIKPGHNRYDFHYTGLSFTAPEKVRFKYRIEGLEKEWTDAGTKRVATYSFLPAGKYVFHVIACNNDGVWNETGVSLAFIILPHLWQKLWFVVLASVLTVAAAAGTVWFFTRRRMYFRLERLKQEQAVERERSRIAKDIHDDLGASLTRITMLSQSTEGESLVPEYVAKNLERIHGTARELTRSMDEIVWAVNPRHDTLDSLASYLSRFAYDFLSVAKIRCRLDVPVQLPAWPLTAEVRHNLFLAFKETLHNVVNHAHASEVKVSLRLEAGKLLLVMEDDGQGFTEGEISDGPRNPDRISRGDGLANIRRRLAEIGGQCDIQSRSGEGTAVKFVVPLASET